jgi:hypothetical protein
MDDEFCRSATKEDLKLLIRSLNEQGADYLLIGGYALFAHGFERATTDINLLVPCTEEAGLRIKKALLLLPDSAAAELDPKWFLDEDNIRVLDEFVVDLILKTCGETYETLKPFCQIVYLEEVPIHTVTLDGLLRTKQTVREKDALDRRVIEDTLAQMRSDSQTPKRKSWW